MATSILLKQNMISNPSTYQNPMIIKLSPNIPFSKSQKFPWLITNNRLTLKCSVSCENLSKPVLQLTKRETKINPFEIVANAIIKCIIPLQETAVAMVFFMAVLLLYAPNSALAAGGARMGGRSFPSKKSSPTVNSPPKTSPRKTSPPENSRPRSSPPKTSHPKTYSSETFRPKTYSPSNSTPNSWSKPSVSPSYVKKRENTIIGDNEKRFVESVSVVGGPPSISQQKNKNWGWKNIIVATTSIVFIFSATYYVLNKPPPQDWRSSRAYIAPPIRTSVIKLQVGVLGSARSLQRDLNRIAETADTSKKEGLTYILTETTLSMLQHPEYCISGYSSVDIKSDMEDVEILFNRLSIEERGNFDEETLVNVDNIKKRSASKKDSTGFNNEYIVITILVAAEGVYKLPTINSSEDLKETLKFLGSILTHKTLAVEVLWTPQDENETLTEREVLENYPHLRLYK